VFPREEAGSFFNARLINIRVDMEAGDGPAIKQRYRVRGYPTFLILDPDGKEVNRFTGAREFTAFMDILELSLDPANSPATTRAAYEETRSLDNAITYLKALRRSSSETLNDEVNRLHAALPEHERYSRDFWDFLAYALRVDNEGELVARVLREKLAADRYLTRERVDDALYLALFELAKKYVGQTLEHATEGETLERINYLPLVSNGKQDAPRVMQLVKHYREGNHEAIAALFNAYHVNSLDATARYRLESMLFAMKHLPPGICRDYLEDKIKYLEAQVTYTRQRLETMP
ncbi:MAG: thioredoxin family protein, partial [Odoribacteraceae bacterium]|nr:thioredoxin family protein [Odoribacteraceae bacterium]